MSRIQRTGKVLLYLFSATASLLVLVAFLAAFELWLFLNTPGGKQMVPQVFTIDSGMSAAEIARLLHKGGVIADTRKFYLLCLLTKSGPKLQAGEYAFSSLSTPGHILDQIVQGKVLLHRVTVPEGSTLAEVASIIEEAGLASAKSVMDLAANRSCIHGLDLKTASLEGYLFPETYYFPRTQSERSILESMVRQFRLHFPAEWQEQARQRGLSIHEVVIMASIVEKEAVVDSERAVIAGVFFNRLRMHMPLQSDPTAVYDLPDFTGPITREHLQRRSPYNTYRNRGLPVGPICNPGASSIKAVLYPENVPYLYFVSNNDGTHRFSTTLDEHNRAVSLYRKKDR
jgi:UPF0755 protein